MLGMWTISWEWRSISIHPRDIQGCSHANVYRFFSLSRSLSIIVHAHFLERSVDNWFSNIPFPATEQKTIFPIQCINVIPFAFLKRAKSSEGNRLSMRKDERERERQSSARIATLLCMWMAYKTAEERTEGTECTWTSISSLNWNEEDFAKKERNRERSIENRWASQKRRWLQFPWATASY